jgi:hypothetical protein
MDGRTDGRTDGQGDSYIPPKKIACGGYNKLEQSKHHHHLICSRHGIAENIVHFELSNNHSLNNIDYILVFFLNFCTKTILL